MANKEKPKYTFTINREKIGNKYQLKVERAQLEETNLYPGDTIEIRVGTGWDEGEDPYIWRLHPYAPKAEGKGPDTSQGQGVWQCDCASADPGEPLKLYSVWPEPSSDARPKTVTLTDCEELPPGSTKDVHWLTGRVAWGPKPSDPCEHRPHKRDNLPFDPELINRSGTPPYWWTRICRRALALLRRSSQ